MIEKYERNFFYETFSLNLGYDPIYVSEEIATKIQELIEKYEWGVSDIFVYAFKKVFINGKKFTQK